MSGEIVIKIESNIDNYTFEILEDDIRNLLESKGVMAEIEDKTTGNLTRTRKEELGITKDDFDQNIKGVLTLGEKIWFNDDLRCRLRICGFSKGQQEKIRKAKFIDISLVNFIDEKEIEGTIHIAGFGVE